MMRQLPKGMSAAIARVWLALQQAFMSACDMALLLVISREVLIKNGLGNSFFCKLSDSLIC
ncbi:hypothetical protein UP01_09830 [Enterobacter roggenkampii]|nr:hypothetical protein UP01_09830 [Enterobacter roggenkampii]